MAEDFNIFNWVRSVTASTASTKARACALSMIQCADKNGITWAKRETLAELTGCQERATQNQLQELETLGLIERHGRVIKLTIGGCTYLHLQDENEHEHVENVHEHAGQGVQISAPRVQELTTEVSKAAPITTHISTHISTKTEKREAIREDVEVETKIASTPSTHDSPDIWFVEEAAKFGIKLHCTQASSILGHCIASAKMTEPEAKEYIATKLTELAFTKYTTSTVVRILQTDAGKWKADREPNAKLDRVPYSHIEASEIDFIPLRWKFKSDQEFRDAWHKWTGLCKARGIDPETKVTLPDADMMIIQEGVRNELR